MKKKHDNPFCDLAELELNTAEKADLDGETDIYSELRFSTYQIDIENLRVEIGVSRATLQLELFGAEIKPGTRLNDGTRTHVERIVEAVDERESSLSAQLNIDSSRPSASSFGLGGGLEKRSGVTDTTRTVQSHQRVKAKAGQKWIIEEPGADSQLSLDDTYISNERLCIVVQKEKANMTEATATISIRKYDLNIQPEGMAIQKDFRKLVHKEKIIKALIAKSLSKSLGQEEYAHTHGIIVISQSKITEDGGAGS